nr:MAG TPA: PROTEIN/DNA Complex catalytic motif, Helix-turn-helix DNA [Caudoviricetes sp.]
MLKNLKTKIVRKIEREYQVFNSKNELVDSFPSMNDLCDDYNITKGRLKYYLNKNRYVRMGEVPELYKVKSLKKVITEIIEHKSFVLSKHEIQNIPKIKGEEWKQIPDYRYFFCSNLGRFKIVDSEGNEKLLTLTFSKNKTKKTYTDVNLNKIDENGHIEKGQKFRTSRILAQTWIDPTLKLSFKEDKRNVDHIDNNSQNECITNLRVCSHSDNINYAIYEQERVTGRPIRKCYRYDIYTHEVKEYPSTNKFVEDMFHSNNNGYFNHLYKRSGITQKRYSVGYSIEEARDSAFLNRCKLAKTDEDKIKIYKEFGNE